ncbi:MAG: recombinase RecA [Mycoplasmoidaceae bacterium]
MKNKIKNDVLDETITNIQNKYGKGSLRFLDDKIASDEDVISSGSVSLDNVLGINGFPKGRIIEIYGNESSGKTTIALQCIAECQKNKGNVAYIDAENALDGAYCKKIGVDLSKMLLCQPDSGEQAFSVIDALLKTNQMDLIVVDSVAALVPESELNGEVYDQNIGAHARLMSKGLRMIQAHIAKSNTAVIFINQIREKVGIIFGNPEVTTGGRALKFFSSIRLEVRKSELIKSGSEIIGIKSKITITKNKLAPPLKVCYVDIFFGEGFNFRNEIINFSIDYEIIKKSGSWYYYNDVKICQGRNQIDKFLLENENIYNDIKKLILDRSRTYIQN